MFGYKNTITNPQKSTFMNKIGSGKNLFNINDIGILTNTVVQDTHIWSASGGITFFLPCNPMTSYTISRQVAGTRFRAVYTSNYPALNVTTYDYTTNDEGISITLPPNPNANYIVCYIWRVADQGAFTLAGLNSVGVQVEIGEAATDYEAYSPKYELEDDFQTIKNFFSGKKVSILGDSISTFTGYVPTANRCRYPQADLLTNSKDTWWMKLITNTGMILGINESWAGSRVSWDGTTESADIGADKHMASDARIGHLNDNGEPDYILFYGGTNDIGGDVAVGTFDGSDLTTLAVDTFANAYSTAIIKLQTAYPDAKIIVLTPIYTASYYTNVEADTYNEVIKEITDFFGVLCINTRECGISVFNRATYLPDGIHPNAAGMDLIYRYVLDAMLANKYFLTA